MKNKLYEIDKALIIEAIKNSNCFAETLKNLGCIDNTWNRNYLKKIISEEKIDLSHYIRRRYRKEYEKNPNKCKNCGKELPFEKRDNKFCDHSCSATYNNPKKPDRKHYSFCLNCGKKFSNSKKGKFCNSTCFIEYNHKEYIKKWESGEGFKNTSDTPRALRSYLMEKSNYSCEICGWGKINPYTGKYPLQIHHIDGDCTNNTKGNLLVLCPNCHSLTNNFGSRNKACTRKYKRYNKSNIDENENLNS